MKNVLKFILILHLIAGTTVLAHDGKDHPKLVVVPNNLNFCTHAILGGLTPAPVPKKLNVRGANNEDLDEEKPATLIWKATSSESWIKILADSGLTPSEATVWVDPVGLELGDHNGEIRFDTPGQLKPRFVQVKFRIHAPLPGLILEPSEIHFFGTAFSNQILNDSVRVTASGNAEVEFQASNSKPWLVLIPAQGETPVFVKLKAFVDSLIPGTYYDTVIFRATSGENSQEPDNHGCGKDGELSALLPVTLSVSSGGRGALEVVPRQLGFAATFGGTNPQSQQLFLSVRESLQAPWEAHHNQSWLSLDPASGIATGNPTEIAVNVEVDSLLPGLYVDSIFFTSPNAGIDGALVIVFLQIFPPSGLSDSVAIADLTIPLTSSITKFSVPIFASNTQAVRAFILPLRFEDGQTVLDSVTFLGGRAEFADLKFFLRLADPKEFLLFIGFVTTEPLPPGSGTIGWLHFTTTGFPPQGVDTLTIDSTSVSNPISASMGNVTLQQSFSVSYIVTIGGNLFILNPAFKKGTIILAVPSGAEEEGGNRPKKFSLAQNYPNPFNPQTSIAYTLPKAATVRLDVFDILGRVVTTLLDKEQSAGTYNVIWNGRDRSGNVVSTGIYFYRFKTNEYAETKKMLFVK